MKRGLALAFLCFLIHYQSFNAWFRADDFAWLGLSLGIHSVQDLIRALFAPAAEGTFRPLSERAFFIVGYHFFGLNVMPFRMVIFATMFGNLALVNSIGDRLTGVRWAGFCAAVLWLFNSALVEPLGWVCVYNQVLCAFLMLLAFHFLLRYVETGRTLYNGLQWAAFLIGFGAMELNVVYPLLAGAYTFFCARKYFRRTLPLLAPAVVYFIAHRMLASGDNNPQYTMHFTGAMVKTFAKYWAWSLGPAFYWTPGALSKWVVAAGVAVVSLGLLVFAADGARMRRAAFCVAWFAIAIAPVLPLRDHLTEYYPFIPVIGLCWLGGWAVAEAWRSGSRSMIAACVLAGLYLLMVAPRTMAAGSWNYDVTARVRDLVTGMAGVRDLHPGKTVLLNGVDTTLFWNAIVDHSNRLVGVERVYLTPGSAANIEAHADLGSIGAFVLPATAAQQALAKGQAVVYDVRGPRLRNVTGEYTVPRDEKLPAAVDVGNPLTAFLLGPEWYAIDGNHRWMPKRATLRLAGPEAAGQKLYLHATCPAEHLRAGPLVLTVWVDGTELDGATIHPGETDFERSFPLPSSVVGKAEVQIAVEVSRTFRAGADVRDLGLAFGTFEIR